jgi:hypothetical protein
VSTCGRSESGTRSLRGDMAEDVEEGAAVASIAQLRYIASCPLTSPILRKASEQDRASIPIRPSSLVA